MAASVTADADGFPPHIALPDAPPSVVEIWEPEKPDERKEIEGWDAPFDTVNETTPRVKLAQRIARAVRRLVESGAPVGIERRAARYGDVLILVRQRGPLFEAVIRALKNEQCRGCRCRPPGAHRAYRGDGPDGASRRAVAAGRRSGACGRAAQPAVRIFRRRFVRDRGRARP